MCLLLLAEESKASFENPGLPSVLLSSNHLARRTNPLVTIYSLGHLASREAGVFRTTHADGAPALGAQMRGDVGFVVGMTIRFQLRIHQFAVDFDLK